FLSLRRRNEMSWKTLVVSGFALAAWVSSAAAFSPTADHYLCHQVKDLKNPKFVAIAGVSVFDQTLPTLCDVKKPYLLCNPADKNGSGINDPSTHYCCYKTKCISAAAVTYFISDQFGVHGVQTKKPKFLCNPCDKF